MALLFMDSFDHYVTADMTEKWTSRFETVGTATIGAFGRRSSGAYRATTGSGGSGWGGQLSKTVIPSGAAFVVGFAAKFSVGNTLFFAIGDNATCQIGLYINADFTLSVTRGTTGIAGSTLSLSSSVFAYIEIKGVIHPTSGSVSVRVNGADWITFSGNTRNSANTQWNILTLGCGLYGTFSPSCTFDFDDLYVLDQSGSAPWNNFLGDCRVDVRLPTGAGATTGFTPSAGSNWANVDDVTPNDDTDYNSAATAGLTDTFVVQDAPSVGATIYGVQHNLAARKVDAGVATLAPVIRHGGVDNVGPNVFPGATYSYGVAINQVNPGTGVAWTEADFNAAEFGYKRTT